ncbi:MAG: tRNA (adenosine(37)-N6)-threonylcarbamoyltransferase complex dimerization subunit type 1 TsaB [Gammaproteobacteria bacterium HGW-Gammaproteobacteria-14]|nr:MAG: tRNA (adenosine(37)-N6)-threonylcarbamoyltransferase complex dimerization subunit type 1 TsaB [Gammaproteobacteria bacterium HGW-Gammaproteobacteria-14]
MWLSDFSVLLNSEAKVKLLALETATDACSVALWHDGEVRERFVLAQRRQTELVLPMVESLLAEAGWALTTLDAIAFGQGPGAFTGVRVAVSVAQGLGYAANVPLVGVSTLAATAHHAAAVHGDGNWLIGFDARMNELYLGGYRCNDGQIDNLLEDSLVAPETLPELPALNWRGAGSGDVFLSALRARWPALIDWQGDIGPRAASVAALAAPQRLQGVGVPAEQARPVYLRDKVVQGAVR